MSKNKIATLIAWFLMFAMIVSLVALPFANAQELIMNLPGEEGAPHNLLLGATGVDIDLNGPSSYISNVTLWVKYPGRADFTYIGGYPTTGSGDLDVYNFDFNETGDFALKWALPPDFTIESNVEIARVWTAENWPSGHDPSWEIQTWAYLAVAPNPVGVGQNVYVNMWVDMPLPGASVFNDIRRHDYELTITKPDGDQELHKFDVADATGVQFYVFVPDQVGTYTFSFYYPEQVYTWNAVNTPDSESEFYLDKFKEATSNTVELTVQEEPLSAAITSYPLPTEYWTRPIEGQNTDWWSIASHWLSGPDIIDGVYQRFGSAPTSAHVMWAKPLEMGGVVGGGNTGISGMTYYSGLSYETRNTGTIIMNGRLYYPLPRGNSGTGNGYAVVDLRTGEEIYRSDMSLPSFGQLEWFDSENQHGVIPNGYLWHSAGSTRLIHDALDGKNLFNITHVPSGTMEYGSNGEILIYVLDEDNDWLALWNFTELFRRQRAMTAYRPVGRVIDGSDAFSWNVTLSMDIPSDSSIRYTLQEDVLLFSNIDETYGGRYGTKDPYTVGAISLKPSSRGNVMWMKEYQAPQPQNNTVGATKVWLTTDPVNRVFMMRNKEDLINYGYSVDDGTLLWTTKPIPDVPEWEYFSTSGYTAYGKLYYSGYGGIVYAFDTKDGSLLWLYGNGGEGNSTNNGLNTPWGLYPIHIGAIADGKIYTFSTEHSPNEPMYKDTYVRCLNATTGEELWKIMSWCNPSSFMSPGIATADGYISYLNLYDHRIYVIGKGPSATTVSASPEISVHGSSVLVKGSVIDTSAGTGQDEPAARFPNGVPAVSDAAMGEWMEYVYMQKPRPTDVTGVEVVVSVVDPNNNVYEVGRTTSDANGMFKLMFTPEVPGEYTILATFAGTESYWGSYAEIAIGVTEAPAATPETTPTPASAADLYFIPMSVGMIVAIVIVLALLILILRRR
jgi:hypothetical protein